MVVKFFSSRKEYARNTEKLGVSWISRFYYMIFLRISWVRWAFKIELSMCQSWVWKVHFLVVLLALWGGKCRWLRVELHSPHFAPVGELRWCGNSIENKMPCIFDLVTVLLLHMIRVHVKFPKNALFRPDFLEIVAHTEFNLKRSSYSGDRREHHIKNLIIQSVPNFFCA